MRPTRAATIVALMTGPRGTMMIGLVALATVALDSTPKGTAKPDDWSSAASIRIAPPGEPGDKLIMTGRIADDRNRPIRDASLEVYHADAMGNYSKPGGPSPRLSGTVRTGENGTYRIETIVPSQLRNQEGGPPHIHGWAVAPGHARHGFAVNLTLAPGRYPDAYLRAWKGGRRSSNRTIYQDTLGTWHLIYDPTLP